MDTLIAKILAALITLLAMGSYGVSWNLYSNTNSSLTRIEQRIDGIYQILIEEE